MRLAGIISESVVDGPGVRFVVFAQGCPHHCLGCHNPDTWDPQAGNEFAVKEIIKKIRKIVKNIRGITLSGGEPFLQAKEMAILAIEARKMGLDVVTYTGYVYEDLLKMNIPGAKELLELTDVLIDGPFLIGCKDISLPYRGSTNQRIIDLVATKNAGRLTLSA